MYPMNSAAPPIIDLGEIVLKSNGTQQTSGVLARVKIGTGAWGASAGTLACDATSGIWTYAPTQAETNADFFIIAAYKANCTSVSKTIITSASATSGKVVLSGETHTAAVIPTVTELTSLDAVETKIDTINVNTENLTSDINNLSIQVDDVYQIVLPNLDETISSRASQASVDTVDANVDTILSRVTSTVATMWAALVEMISGSTPNRQFTAKALELGPSSSGGGGGSGPPVVERSPADTNPITFSFPTSGATITGQVSKNNASYVACTGAFNFLRTENSKHFYTLAYNAADRPAAEGTARYVFTDGADTVYVILRVEGTVGLDAAGVRNAVGLSSANLDTQLSTIDDFLDTEIAAIKAKTDNLPSDPADQSAVEAAITAATSGLATTVALAAAQTQINKIEATTAGTASGAGTDTEVFVGSEVTVTITVDEDGNRSSVVVS